MAWKEPAEIARVGRAWRPGLIVGLSGAAASFGWFMAMTLQQAAIVKSTPRQVGARTFIRKLLSKRGRLLLKRAGFGPPKSP